MSLLLRVRGFKLLNKQEKKTVTRLLGWIAKSGGSQVANCIGIASIVEKILKQYFLLFSLLFKHLGITKH